MPSTDRDPTLAGHRVLRADLARLRADLAAHRTQVTNGTGLPSALQAETAILHRRFLVLQERFRGFRDG